MTDIDSDLEQEPQEEQEPQAQEFIEYTGDPNDPNGTTFLHSHTLPKGDALWKRNRVTMRKDLVWERDPLGPQVGFPGANFRIPVEDVPADALALLEKTPGYKRVSE